MAVLGGEEGRGFSQDLLLHAQHSVFPAQTDELVTLGRGQARLVALVDVGLGQPVAKATLADADVGRDLGDRLGPFTGQLDSPTAELRRMRRWHTDSFPEVLPPQCRCPANRGMLRAPFGPARTYGTNMGRFALRAGLRARRNRSGQE